MKATSQPRAGRGWIVGSGRIDERVASGGGFLMRIGGPWQEVDTSVRSVRDQRGRDIDRMSSVEFGELKLHLLEPVQSSRTFDCTYIVRRARYLEVRVPRTLLKP